MLTKSQKEQLVEELKIAMDQNKILVMADYRGLTVKDIDELKKEVREAGGQMRVAKKTLVNVALKDKGIDFDTRKYSGPLAFIFGPEETAIPKKVWNFSRKNDKLKIEGGMLEYNLIAKEDVEALAKLPSKNELLAKLVDTIQGPISGFANVLAGPMKSFVQVMKAISENKV